MKVYTFSLLIISLILPGNAAFAGFWSQCSVYANPVTMEKIVYVESKGNPYDINDNTARRSYSYSNAQRARIAARELIRAGHNIDIGLAQINISNMEKYGIAVRAAFNPCYNVFIGSYILLQGYKIALGRFRNSKIALYRALEYYNSGRFHGDNTYAKEVWEALN